MLDRTRTPVGPHLSKGVILLTFFERRETKSFLGLISNQEKVCFERWRLPIVINERSIPLKVVRGGLGMNSSIADDLEREHYFNSARAQVQASLLTILEVFLYLLIEILLSHLSCY